MKNRLNSVHSKVRVFPLISGLFKKTPRQVILCHGKSWALLPCPRNTAGKEGVTFTRTILYVAFLKGFKSLEVKQVKLSKDLFAKQSLLCCRNKDKMTSLFLTVSSLKPFILLHDHSETFRKERFKRSSK
jgi:hypothetical protein